MSLWYRVVFTRRVSALPLVPYTVTHFPLTLKVFQAFHAMTGVFRGGEREVPMVAMAAKPAMKSIYYFLNWSKRCR